MEKRVKALKKMWQQMRTDAITAAADALGGKISKLADFIKVDAQDLYNWLRRGTKLSHEVGADISEASGVSLYRLRPAETLSNDRYYDGHPTLTIFKVAISSIDVTSFSTRLAYAQGQAQVNRQETERPVILSIKNELISGLKKLDLARRAGDKTVQAIRLDTLALSICSQKILEHPDPDGWLNYELRMIAAYLQAKVKQIRVSYADASQCNESSINKRLGIKGNIIPGLQALSIFKPKSKHHKITNDNDLSENLSKPKHKF